MKRYRSPHRVLVLSALAVGLPALVVACGSTATTDVPDDPQVASVVVTPSAATLDVGDTMTFQAEAFDGSGRSMAGLTPSWSGSPSTVAMVGTTGLVTATDTGSATISALIDGVTGSAVITVNDTTTSPPPPPPSARTVFFTETFEDTNASSRNWFDTGPFVLSTAEKRNGSSSLEWHWTNGAQTPAFVRARKKFTPTESVHVSFWVKYSANWIGSGQNYHPHEFYLLTNVDGDWIGPAETHLTTYIEHNYQGGLRPRLQIQDALNIDTGNINVDLTSSTENRAVAGCNGSTDGYSGSCYQAGNGNWRNEKVWDRAPYLGDTPGPQYKNDWHFVEAYFQLNSVVGGVGQTDGIVRYWIDGNLLIDHADVVFRTGQHPSMKFHEIMLGPYIGPGSPADQSVWVDDLEVADQR